MIITYVKRCYKFYFNFIKLFYNISIIKKLKIVKIMLQNLILFKAIFIKLNFIEISVIH